jgi:hypothetical protein
MDKAFNEELAKRTFQDLVLIRTLGDSKSSDALSVSLGFNLETVTSAPVGVYGYKTVINIYSEIFFFDFDEKKIINSIPINLQHIYISDNKPTSKEVRDLFSGLLYGTNPSVSQSFFSIAADKLAQAKVCRTYGARYKVEDVELRPKAQAHVQSWGIDEQAFKTIAAQMFTRALVDELGLAVVPYTKGQAIGNKMAARFANGDAFMFDLPKAEYEFKISFGNFLTKSDRSHPGLDYEAYFDFMKISFSNPDFERTYLDHGFRGSSTAKLIKGQPSVPFVAYIETMIAFFNGFAKNLRQNNSEWVLTVVGPKRLERAMDQLNAVCEIIKNNP